MPTQTKENYLKALYYLHQKSKAISITDLGKEMDVSKPTANDMVKKLQTKGWVKYERYKPLTFTEKGIKEAAQIIRKHRLSEMFLTQIMSIGWERVHEIAEELEHVKSELFFDRMDELLGYPSVDPHGSTIPDKNGYFVKRNLISLTKITPGKKVVIRALSDSSAEFLLFLNKKEISLGTEIEVVDIEPFDKSVSVTYNKFQNQTLSQSVCSRLLVEE